jgi:enoyl-[acyl-carrier protein] reductase I
VRYAKPYLSPHASIVTLTYSGSQRIIPRTYNTMGVAKAALECTVKYLASEMGVHGIRVNAVSAGPIKTLAASGIPDFNRLLAASRACSPLKNNIQHQDVAYSTLYLLSPMSISVTGEVHYVDGGSLWSVPPLEMFKI